MGTNFGDFLARLKGKARCSIRSTAVLEWWFDAVTGVRRGSVVKKSEVSTQDGFENFRPTQERGEVLVRREWILAPAAETLREGEVRL